MLITKMSAEHECATGCSKLVYDKWNIVSWKIGLANHFCFSFTLAALNDDDVLFECDVNRIMRSNESSVIDTQCIFELYTLIQFYKFIK